MIMAIIWYLSSLYYFEMYLLLLRSSNQHFGVATLQGLSNNCIDSRRHSSSVAIMLLAVPESFLSISLSCGAILGIYLLLRRVLPSFFLITLNPYIYCEGEWRNPHQIRISTKSKEMCGPVYYPGSVNIIKTVENLPGYQIQL